VHFVNPASGYLHCVEVGCAADVLEEPTFFITRA